MIDADFDAFAAVVGGFAELKGRVLSANAVRLYWATMRDHWDLADFKAAAEQLLRSCAFMPTPKDFEDLRKAGRMTAGEAWALVLDHARGHCKLAGDIDDPVLQGALRAIGGMHAVQMSETDKTHFLERRFCEHYETIEDAEEIREAVPQLAATPLHARLQWPTIESAQAELPRLSAPAAAPIAAIPRPPVRATAADPPRDLRADIRKLAAAGFDAEGIALALRPRGVTLQQVSECLEERLSA